MVAVAVLASDAPHTKHGQLRDCAHTSPLCPLRPKRRFELVDARQQQLDSTRKPSVLGDALRTLLPKGTETGHDQP